MTRAMRLAAHIEAHAGVPCAWGVSDCTRWAADWAEAELGRSLGLPRYRGEAEGRALMNAAGGLVALWERACARNGLMPALEPALGDVGIIETRLYGPVGVVFAASGVAALRTTQSVTYLRPRQFLRAWSI